MIGSTARTYVSLCGLAVVLFLAGCSGTSEVAPTPSVTVGGKTFSGPWASDFAQQYNRSSSDFVKEILRDGKITDAEFAEVTEKYKACLKAAGITFQGQRPDGSTDIFFPNGVSAEDGNQKADVCGRESGEDAVGGLYFAQQRNPKHLDEATIVSACLVKKQVVPRGYDARDYAKDSPRRDFPFTDPSRGEAALDECMSDPLGLQNQ